MILPPAEIEAGYASQNLSDVQRLKAEVVNLRREAGQLRETLAALISWCHLEGKMPRAVAQRLMEDIEEIK